ncbi:MAG: hypothetical protein HZA17_09895 [Nitrospirae bacterium]|nr:hypothetical protein [Nitrospirota bacterium]
MDNREKAVIRFNNGCVMKGFLKDFSTELEEMSFEEAGTGAIHRIRIEELKAVFFVKSFEGNSSHKEKKSYGITRSKGNRVFIKFRDNEALVGFLVGDVPWKRGFFLSRQDKGRKGFFLLPVDEDSNNIKVFVVLSSINDVTVVP